MSFNHVQDAADKIVKQVLTQPGDNEQQPYEKESIKRFILEEINSLRQQGKTESEIEGLVGKVDIVFEMKKSEFRLYCERLDTINAQYIKDYNEDIVYREMIKIIISSKGLVGIAAKQLEKKLLQLTPLGFKKSYPQIYFPLEKHILELEHIKEKLKPKDSIMSTVEKIRIIDEERNKLVGNNPHQLGLKPRK